MPVPPDATNPPANMKLEDVPCANPGDFRITVFFYPCFWVCQTVMFDYPDHSTYCRSKCLKENGYCLK